MTRYRTLSDVTFSAVLGIKLKLEPSHEREDQRSTQLRKPWHLLMRLQLKGISITLISGLQTNL